MKRKVTRFLVEITLVDKANKSYIDEILDDEDIYSYKVKKVEDVVIDIKE